MLSYDELAAGSDIHFAREVAGAIVIAPLPDCLEEFDALVGHLYEVEDRDFVILPQVGTSGLYESAQIARLN